MPKSASQVAEARRHVAEFERRVERQRRLIEELERDKHVEMADHGYKVLRVLEESLRLARVHLQTEIDHHGDDEAQP